MSFSDLIVNQWGAQFMGRNFHVSVGVGGIGTKSKEGDGVTPKGRFRIEKWYYRADKLHLERDAIAIQQGDCWGDDPNGKNYNNFARNLQFERHEKLYRTDALYDVIGVIDYNRNPIKNGQGSAIFLHIWRRPRYPTQGCVAFAKADIKFIANNWSDNSHLIVR